MLTDAALEGKIDRLNGLKENVIIGKLIPAATGLKRYRTHRDRARQPLHRRSRRYRLLDEDELAAELGLGGRRRSQHELGPSFDQDHSSLEAISSGGDGGGLAEELASLDVPDSEPEGGLEKVVKCPGRWCGSVAGRLCRAVRTTLASTVSRGRASPTAATTRKGVWGWSPGAPFSSRPARITLVPIRWSRLESCQTS